MQLPLATGDVIRIAVESGVVKYKKNGTTFYTSTVSPTYPLNADTALYSNTSTINNVKISGNVSTPGPIHWLVADQLGTPRIVFDQTGSLSTTTRHDYLPFGEELFANGRNSQLGYGNGDGVRQQFTQKERDNETELDYSLNRYYSYKQGRFTSPDPTLASLRGSNPQTLNRYAYVLNNPLLFIDPFGLWELEYSPEYENGRTDRVKTIKVYFHKTKDGDNADSLLKQLGFKSTDKGYKEMKAKIETAMSKMSDIGIEAASLSGKVAGVEVGGTFKTVGDRIGDQANYEVGKVPDKFGPQQPFTYADCTMTTSRISFGAQPIVGLNTGDNDAFNSNPLSMDDMFLSRATQAQVGALRLLDVVRYDGDGNPDKRHYMSVIFTDDNGTSEAFSRSGERGRFEIIDVTQTLSGYGSIGGAGKNKTGFYRP